MATSVSPCTVIAQPGSSPPGDHQHAQDPESVMPRVIHHAGFRRNQTEKVVAYFFQNEGCDVALTKKRKFFFEKKNQKTS
jgi:hypothetical protein